jgi:hypothetical protein
MVALFRENTQVGLMQTKVRTRRFFNPALTIF